MSEVRISATGRLTAAPKSEERGGATKTEFTLATNPSAYRNGEWTDLPAVFTQCQAWRGLATAIAAAYASGTLVVVSGVMRAREYQGQDGAQKRFQYLEVDEIGRHISSKDSPDSAGTMRSATEPAQSGDNGQNWGNYASETRNGPYEANSGGFNPYQGAGNFNPYGGGNGQQSESGPVWGQP